jgi:heparosan-N-sulfate-glucuronate 5-epimerase
MLERARKFFSSTFDQPLGTRLGEGSEVRGYYIDLRVKPWRPDFAGTWPYEPGRQTWIALAQIALGAHELWLAGEGEEWLGLARDAGDHMLEHQIEGGPRDGAWEQRFDLPHTYDLKAPWISAMAQGEAASLMVRLHAVTGEERYADAARRAVRTMSVPMAEGGASARVDGRPFPQEYPTTPSSHVLNGALFAIWGWYDVALALGDADAGREFEEAVDTLALNLHRWDTGSWSRYDLYPHRVRNWASLAYHELHVNQLRAMHALSPRPELAATADRWEAHAGSKAGRARALAHKSAFRVLVPR